MYRIWNNKDKCWVKSNIALLPNMDIVQLSEYKRRKPEISKITLLPDSIYSYQYDIKLFDRNEKLIFEGDIIKISSTVIGVVTYIPEKARYAILDYTNMEYYSLNVEKQSHIEVIGNVFENRDLLLSDINI